MIIQTDVIVRLLDLLQHNQVSIVIPALRSLGNIVTGNETQTNEVLKH